VATLPGVSPGQKLIWFVRGGPELLMKLINCLRGDAAGRVARSEVDQVRELQSAGGGRRAAASELRRAGTAGRRGARGCL